MYCVGSGKWFNKPHTYTLCGVPDFCNALPSPWGHFQHLFNRKYIHYNVLPTGAQRLSAHPVLTVAETKLTAFEG